MKKLLVASFAIVFISLNVFVSLAGAPPRQTTTFRSFSVEGQSLQGDLGGPWEWTGKVVVTGSGITLTCDSLKLWLTPDGRDAERIEASGNIRVQGRYVAADKTEWEVNGKAAAASYERKTGQGSLRGEVNFEAKNLATGAMINAAAEKLIYDLKTKRFRFERGEQPVRMEWQEPQPAPATEPAPQKANP